MEVQHLKIEYLEGSGNGLSTNFSFQQRHEKFYGTPDSLVHLARSISRAKALIGELMNEYTSA